MLTDYFPLLSNAKPTLLVPLTFNRVEKTKKRNFDFVRLLSFTSYPGIT